MNQLLLLYLTIPILKEKTMSSNLVLEVRSQNDTTQTMISEEGNFSVSFTPEINEDYWEYRVIVSDKQAIVGFPKFFTIGIGFAVEEDWNTNLPYTSETQTIFEHIKHNRGDDSISDEDIINAISMIQEAASKGQ